MIEFISVVVFGTVMFLAGAFWKDRKAAKVEKDFEQHIEALRLVVKSYSQELRTIKIFGSKRWPIEYLEDERKLYASRRDACLHGSREAEYNRGAVHAIDAMILNIRGWL